VKVLVVNHGTIPVLVAPVYHEDKPATEAATFPIGDWQSDVTGTEFDVRLVTIEDGSQWLGIAWSDDSGFNYLGFRAGSTAFSWLYEEDRYCDTCGRGETPKKVGKGHYAITIGEGEDEEYRHIFNLRAEHFSEANEQAPNRFIHIEQPWPDPIDTAKDSPYHNEHEEDPRPRVPFFPPGYAGYGFNKEEASGHTHSFALWDHHHGEGSPYHGHRE
jgi:hypothetical protein